LDDFWFALVPRYSVQHQELACSRKEVTNEDDDDDDDDDDDVNKTDRLPEMISLEYFKLRVNKTM